MFSLLETCLYSYKTGNIYLKQYHLQRIFNSAKYFGFYFNKNEIINKITNVLSKQKLTLPPYSILRLTLQNDGQFNINCPNKNIKYNNFNNKNYVNLGLSANNIDINIKEFYLHKTTYRKHYEEHSSINISNHNYDDIILYNNNGYITECCKANIAILNQNNKWITPPLQDTLLAGTMRQYLLYYYHNSIQLGHITINELKYAKKIIWFNSVRGILPAKLIH